MQRAKHAAIDFEEWSALAAADPQRFEARRTEVIEELISQAPKSKQAQLRRLQWRIDQVRRRSPTPVSACIKLSKMMWESVSGEGGLVDALHALQRLESLPPRRSATVISMRRSPPH